MIKPVSYLQTDSRWKNTDYSASGESTTIGASGCGPSCMAMVIATLKDSSVTPVTTCAWSLKKGYKAPNQGTYYTYFVPQGAAYGIEVSRINTSNIYGSSSSTAKKAHAEAVKALKDGKWVIACMGKGNWTRGGHYILAYGIDGDNVLINDPNSTKAARLCADIKLWQSQVKYYWIVEVGTTTTEEEEEEMTQEQFNKMADNYFASLAKAEPAAWSKEQREWAEKNKLITGNENGEKKYKSFVTREQLVVFMKRLFDVIK